ncbi:hypothetical protein G4V62_18020 [Bacillaceae bacterium SIJ1]|uniref:hypothetical protein n=1 Tax=Litoribacterium kuwaitense TaxID=1398745 RepID=UPI0013EA4C66|nr:hypothetical protein [Litoribacterium kuwaitense]NGP46748.1 hypothetical protein [Litoribacterium kuwaitense]
MKYLLCAIGLLFGVISSIVVAYHFNLFVQILAGGGMSVFGPHWVYLAVIVPFSINFVVLGAYFNQLRELSLKKLAIISLISAFLVTLYSGTIGAIFGVAIVREGIETINFLGTFKWGTIYAFILFPFTVPLAIILIGFFYIIVRILKKVSLK